MMSAGRKERKGGWLAREGGGKGQACKGPDLPPQKKRQTRVGRTRKTLEGGGRKRKRVLTAYAGNKTEPLGPIIAHLTHNRLDALLDIRLHDPSPPQFHCMKRFPPH